MTTDIPTTMQAGHLIAFNAGLYADFDGGSIRKIWRNVDSGIALCTVPAQSPPRPKYTTIRQLIRLHWVESRLNGWFITDEGREALVRWYEARK